MEYEYKDIHDAYIKLKTYIYYDSTNLYMRKQLAIFETDLSDEYNFLGQHLELKRFKKEYNVTWPNELKLYEKKLFVFTSALNKYHENPEYFNKFLSSVKHKFLPKKIKDESSNSNIITNRRIFKSYNVSRWTVFIDAPIEIHLISVLWLLRTGVSLDKKLFDNCLGNRLILNKDKTHVVQGSGLFKPYHNQYQKWRDDSVSIAREHLAKGENILLLNLDIKDFFYSVRIPKSDIYKTPHENNQKSLNNLYLIFGRIHEEFTGLLAKKYKTPYDFSSEVYNKEGMLDFVVLPIGLLSSFVLANHHLSEFDERILKNSKPIYYGRYVDDILMVISNPQLPENDHDDKLKELNFDFAKYKKWLSSSKYDKDEKSLRVKKFDELNHLERFVIKNFFPIVTLIDQPAFLNLNKDEKPSHDRVFKINGYDRLYCQSEKTLLYFFDKDESTLVIDKLKKDLEEKSSEFRNYSDDNAEMDFERSAYHLLYDGTEGKIRTLKDYKEDRFGISVYLTKRIFSALNTDENISDDNALKIVKFFGGSNALNLYTLWERVFVFLLVNNKPNEYLKFYINCRESVECMISINNSSNIHYDEYQSHLFEYLESANELALSLYPSFLSEIKKVKRQYEISFNKLRANNSFFYDRYSPTNEESYYIRRYRSSNLIRHHYTAQPLITFTQSQPKNFINYTDLKTKF